MRTMFWRIFLSFWATMILIVAGTAIAIYWIVSDWRSDPSAGQELEPLAQEAGQVLMESGRDGLRGWLEERSQSPGEPTVFVFDDSRRELLGRVPTPAGPAIGRRLEFRSPPGPSFQAERFVSAITDADGRVYTLAAVPDRPAVGRWFLPFGRSPFPPASLAIAIIITAVTCFALARYLSAPISKLRLATRAAAAGDLSVRVGPFLGRRRDEFALLAADFDHMSERLRVLLDGRQQLMRDLSHELRSPLARQQIALGLARRPGAQVEAQLDRIEREAGRMDVLVGQILMLSRLDDPGARVSHETLDMGDLLETLIQDSNLESASRRIVVELRKHDVDTVQVTGDRQLLGSAIENVLRNAIRYSPDGGPIDVEMRTSYGQVQIAIMDRGPGVSPKDLLNIFVPFFRGEAQVNGSAHGHGLGLAITQRIMALHFGSVHARNRDGGGLTIELRLPHK